MWASKPTSLMHFCDKKWVSGLSNHLIRLFHRSHYLPSFYIMIKLLMLDVLAAADCVCSDMLDLND